MRKGFDLLVTLADGTEQGYVVDQAQQVSVVHEKRAPNVPLSGYATPAQAGGQYDVRDSDGNKAIAHIDWSSGGGQRSLDRDDASPYKFSDSYCIDTHSDGQISLCRDVEHIEVLNCSGPIFYAMGYVWYGDAMGGLHYSSDDGATWAAATVTLGGGNATSEPVSSIATDGSRVYFCVGAGRRTGIWANTGVTPTTFAPFGSTPTSDAIRHIAVLNGLMYATTDDGVGSVDTTTGVFTVESDLALNDANQSVALFPCNNAVYWVTSQGEKSYVYEQTYDPDAATYGTKQFAEFPVGFIATCGVGYLSSVYVGGYWATLTDGVGRGAIYKCTEGMTYPLLALGEKPEDTVTPADDSNDNRIYAVTAGAKDLYFATNRAAYRWSIDKGGYNHIAPLNGFGVQELVSVWNPGSNYSWDGSDMTSADPVHEFYPSGYSAAFVGERPGVVGESGLAIAKVNDRAGYPGQYYIRTITAYDYSGTISSCSVNYYANYGNTPHAISVIGADSTYLGNDTFDTYIEVSQSTYSNIHSYSGITSIAGTVLSSMSWESSGGTMYSIYYGMSPEINGNTGYDTTTGVYYGGTTTFTGTPSGSEALDNASGVTFEIAFTKTDWGICTVVIDDGTYQYAMYYYTGHTGAPSWVYVPKWRDGAWYYGDTTRAVSFNATSEDRIRIFAIGNTLAVSVNDALGIHAEGLKASSGSAFISIKCEKYLGISEIRLNSVGASPTSHTDESRQRPSLAYSNGRLWSVWTDSSEIVEKTVTSVSAANPAVITCTAHGVATGQVVHLLGLDADTTGSFVATYVGADTFSIPVDTTGGVTDVSGLLSYSPSSGYSHLINTFPASGWLEQSATSFHTGSMLKSFYYLEVSHDPLPEGAYLLASWTIDGQDYASAGVAVGDAKTAFTISKSGYNISTKLFVYRGTATTLTPRINAVNVVWDFVKNKYHTYMLDCRPNARGGSIQQDPATIIQHLWSAADQRCLFEDRMIGEYYGTVDTLRFPEANESIHEDYTGLVEVKVKED